MIDAGINVDVFAGGGLPRSDEDSDAQQRSRFRLLRRDFHGLVAGPASSPRLPARKRILVIESPPEVVPQLLRASGHLVMNRTNTSAAQELWQKASGGFDLVIIDDRTGAQSLIPAILAYKPATKVILMSAKPEEYHSSNPGRHHLRLEPSCRHGEP